VLLVFMGVISNYAILFVKGNCEARAVEAEKVGSREATKRRRSREIGRRKGGSKQWPGQEIKAVLRGQGWHADARGRTTPRNSC
jgi:hypothetical protein